MKMLPFNHPYLLIRAGERTAWSIACVGANRLFLGRDIVLKAERVNGDFVVKASETIINSMLPLFFDVEKSITCLRKCYKKSVVPYTPTRNLWLPRHHGDLFTHFKEKQGFVRSSWNSKSKYLNISVTPLTRMRRNSLKEHMHMPWPRWSASSLRVLCTWWTHPKWSFSHPERFKKDLPCQCIKSEINLDDQFTFIITNANYGRCNWIFLTI